MTPDPQALVASLRDWGAELGFQQVGITGIDLSADEPRLQDWLARHYHGEMAWLTAHDGKRSRPAALVPGTLSVISVRCDYLPEPMAASIAQLQNPAGAYVSRYALGRDYHKTLRGRLRSLARRLEEVLGPFGHRVFTDSAPVLEKPLARNAGLGWIGKHTNLINRHDGSWFFLGEIFTDLELPPDLPQVSDHCGSCTRCIEVCPTAAIIAPYVLDARRCISYLTIELRGVILGNPHAASIAIVIPEGGTVREVKTGAEIVDGVTIKEIHNQHIILQDHGVSRTVSLRALESGAAQAPAPVSSGSTERR